MHIRCLHILVCLSFCTLFIIQCSSQLSLSRSESGFSSSTDHIDTTSHHDSVSVDTASGRALSRYPTLDTTILDTLMSKACRAGKDSLFARTDSLLDSALTILEMNEFDSSSVSVYDRYYQRLVDAYAECLPASYTPPASKALASRVLRRRLSRAMDTISISPNDSEMVRTILKCSNTEYSIPVEWNDRVYRAMKVLESGRKVSIIRALRRARVYLPYFKQEMKKHGIPEDLAYLPLIESGFNPYAYSYAHASGIWQFIPSTARMYGMRVGYWIDERRDLVKSTRGAITYLKKLHNDFDDWYLALASYNCGENRTSRAIRKAGGSRNFWDLSLPRQTMNYVPQFIASLVLAKNPQCFGYTAASGSGMLRLDSVHVNTSITLETIAASTGLDVDTLKKLNPHIRKGTIPPNVEDVTVYLPEGKGSGFREYYAINAKKDNVRWQRYTIRYGDNLSTIADRFNVPVYAIKSLNNMYSNRIIAGHHLYIPVPVSQSGISQKKQPHSPARNNSTHAHTVRRGETLFGIAQRHGTDIKTICRLNNISDPHTIKTGDRLVLSKQHTDNKTQAEAKAPAEGKRGYYTVKSGDNLFDIARYLGVSIAHIKSWNQLNGAHPVIYPGDRLVYYTAPRDDSSSRDDNAKEKTPDISSVTTAQHSFRYTIKKDENLWSISQKFGTSVSRLTRINGISETTVLHPGDTLLISRKKTDNATQTRNNDYTYYTVRKGDTVWDIARDYKIPVEKVYSLNGLTPHTRIQPGDTLKLLAEEQL